MCADHVETACSGMALRNGRVFCAGRDARAKRAHILDGDELQVAIFDEVNLIDSFGCAFGDATALAFRNTFVPSNVGRGGLAALPVLVSSECQGVVESVTDATNSLLYSSQRAIDSGVRRGTSGLATYNTSMSSP